DYGPVTFTVPANGAFHFSADDLESGNPAKGIEGSTGPGTGRWRLELTSDADIEALAYVRHADGFLDPLHGTAPRDGGGLRLATVNPGSNWRQASHVRLSHRGAAPLAVRLAGTDDAGLAGGAVTVTLPAGGAASYGADALESGAGAGAEGRLGDGRGKWRILAAADAPFTLVGLMEGPSGRLTNLSGPPLRPVDGKLVVPLLPSTADPWGRQGVLRVVNRSDAAGEVRVKARDGSGMDYEPVTLAVGAGEAVHLNSHDLETGGAAKGLTGSTGPAHTGHWWLELSGGIDFEALAYVRHADGFLTAIHGSAPAWGGARRVATFNPGGNTRQASLLRLLNVGPAAAAVRITGIDDAGATGGPVTLTVPARRAVTLSARALEAGGGGLEGALGDGAGKWRLAVEAADGDAARLRVMGLVEGPGGRLSNLSARDPSRG
ncbi:MAG: hypothetical protein OXG51_10525, partial [Gammaproteobacteria bacterium]|nr:hypothetical protein [Gammaproteobacteria bacterium]